MLARKCDRCGAFYDEGNITERDIHYIKTLKRIAGDVCEVNQQYDLCEACADDFIRWIMLLPDKVREG